MTLELDKVHEYTTGKKGEPKMLRVRPAVRLRKGDSPPIFVQDGKFWYEGGEEEIPQDELPEWVAGQLDLMSADARREVGLDVPKGYVPRKGRVVVQRRRASVQKENDAEDDSGDDSDK